MHATASSYGQVAQPTVPGLRSILTILGCQPHSAVYSHSSSRRPSVADAPPRRSSFVTEGKPTPPAQNAALDGGPLHKTKSGPNEGSKALGKVEEVEEGKAIWFSTREETLSELVWTVRKRELITVYCNGRPYVLRDAAKPTTTLALSDRAKNLEDIERRLKIDILDEARKYGGMILTHDEVSGQEIIPTWVSVDEKSIQTPKEVWEEVAQQGWRCEYWRIPIAPDRPIEVSLRRRDVFCKALCD